jgi:NO-binding membrane sensor protein with MHYT domain/nitrogen-specific signal transduction histidine kinase/ActR/RegA family two-component response regulator
MPYHAGLHAPVFALLSIVIAVLGSWTALDLFRRARANAGPARATWLVATAVAMGLSIWSMHFVAMLGWNPGVPVLYDPALTAVSLVLPILAAGVGFALAARRAIGPLQVPATGALVGAGICAMHYVGMAAVRGPLTLSYDPWLVAASFLIAVVASTGALAAARRDISRLWRSGAALVLGLAVVGMHYTGMAALHVSLAAPAGAVARGAGPLSLASALAGGTLLLLMLGLTAAMFDRRFEALSAREAAALRRSQQQLRALIEQMPIGVIVAEAPSGRIRFGNAEAERLLRQPVDESASWRGSRDYGGLHEDGSFYAVEEYQLFRAVHHGERVDRERVRYRRGDGEVVTLEVSSSPVRNEAGEIELGVVAFQDVTATLAAEAALRQSQRMEAVGQLTGGVAHDFNNLLTAVIGSISLALRRVDDAKVRRLLENAQHGARRGAALTAQLLAFSRRQRLETRPVDVNEMLGGMCGLLSSTLGGAIRVELGLEAALPAATADPTQLELAVLNLSINARDAMPEGGLLSIETGLARVDRAGAAHEPEPGDYVTLAVRDNGVGMTPEVLARAFEPFFTTKPVGRGSGLGLSQVSGLAKQMGGGVRVATAPGRGTRVTLYLPRAAEAPAGAERREAAPPATVRSGAVVLVVDDDEDVRRYVAELLRDAGYDVESSPGGADALARVSAGLRPDLMLLDFAMPEMNGAEAALRLRATHDAPVLMMTGYADLDALPATLDRGRVLQKPFEPEALLAAVGGLLRAEQAAAE